MNVIDMQNFYKEFITPERFLKLTTEERRNILDTQIVANLNNNDLANPNFGGILVQWNTPKY